MKRFIAVLGVIVTVVAGFIFIEHEGKKTVEETEASQYEVSIGVIFDNMKAGAKLIDVRTAEEYEKDHAEGAINVPLAEIQNGKQLEYDKDEIIYLYCHSGNRASQAKAILEQQGFEHVINIESLYKWVSMGGENVGTNPVCAVDSANNC